MNGAAIGGEFDSCEMALVGSADADVAMAGSSTPGFERDGGYTLLRPCLCVEVEDVATGSVVQDILLRMGDVVP